MDEENKNLKDVSSELGMAIKDNTISISYTKTNKLITGLYMVTDTIEKDEPIRAKLRGLGVEILSDINSLSAKSILALDQKIAETMSFLEIASTINLISEMNASILKKEFVELRESIKQYTKIKPLWLEDFLHEPEQLEEKNKETPKSRFTFLESPIGQNEPAYYQQTRTRIGVQKGSTLMKALSTAQVSDIHKINKKNSENFNALKKERRDNILSVIRDNGGNATITDIKNKINNMGEKTLQRELFAMVKDSVLYKTGEKRWSKYFIQN